MIYDALATLAVIIAIALPVALIAWLTRGKRPDALTSERFDNEGRAR